MAATNTLICSCSLSTASFPPKLPLPNTAPPSTVTISPSHRAPGHQSPSQSAPQGFEIRRREIAVLLSLGALLHPLHRLPPALAFNIGISGPKDWLKEQKKKSAKFLLAPIDASRRILRSAYLLLSGKDAEYGDKELEEVQRLVRSAARDCVATERNAFVAFQAQTGVEVCTFTLVVKNASSLLDDVDLKKLDTEESLNDLVRSFTVLNSMVSDSNIQVVSDREKLADAVMKTIFFLNKFEEGVRNCLDV
ncbi:hypothetical protein Dimus_025550 [Dionaea muscipula]